LTTGITAMARLHDSIRSRNSEKPSDIKYIARIFQKEGSDPITYFELYRGSEMIELTIHWPDIKYVARIFRKEESDPITYFELYQISGYDSKSKCAIYPRKRASVSTHSTNVLAEAEVFASGSVKWDGCTNFMFPGQEECMLHECNRVSLVNIGVALSRVWDAASTSTKDE
jgi:hypothetical protein